jgi:hypothetical protein
MRPSSQKDAGVAQHPGSGRSLSSTLFPDLHVLPELLKSIWKRAKKF